MGKKILVIDDEKGILLTLTTRLKANHFEVITAMLGTEGVEKARNCRPDLILLDILFPDIDGYEVLRRLKECAETEKIPVIMMTVKFHKEDVENAVALGAVDYLIKPFNANVLVEKINNALSSKDC